MQASGSVLTDLLPGQTVNEGALFTVIDAVALCAVPVFGQGVLLPLLNPERENGEPTLVEALTVTLNTITSPFWAALDPFPVLVKQTLVPEIELVQVLLSVTLTMLFPESEKLAGKLILKALLFGVPVVRTEKVSSVLWF